MDVKKTMGVSCLEVIKYLVEHLSTLLSAISVTFVVINFYYLQKHNRESDYVRLRQDVTTNIVKMVEIHHQIVYRMRKKSNKENNGLAYLHNLVDEYEEKLQKSKICDINTDEWENILQEVYNDFFDDNHNQLGQYFRYVYNVFKLIDKSGLKEDDRQYLSSLYIAQFSGWEYTLLLLNCMFYKKGEKFCELVFKYRIFEHMSDKRISKFDKIINKEKGFVYYKNACNKFK